MNLFPSRRTCANPLNLSWRRLLPLALGVLAVGIPAMAGQKGAVQCEVNEERVWVYDSLANLNVEARLNCGDSVEILGQEKGYVKIRTTSGRVGYVPKDTLPNLPAAASPSGTNTAADQPISLAEAALRAREALEKEREQPATPKQLSAAAIPEKRAEVSAAANPRAQVAYVPAEEPARPKQQISARAPEIPVPTATVRVNSSARPAVATNMPVAPEASAAPAPPMEIVLSTSEKDAMEAPAPAENPVVENSPAANHAPPAAARTMQLAPAAAPAALAAVQPVQPVHQSVTAAPARPAAISVTTEAPAPEPAPVEIAASSPEIPAEPTRSARSPSTDVRARHGESSNASMDEEDDADASLSAVEASRQNCNAYFSAYGLTPNQFKWMMTNRKKKFPGICPASLPALVDYVIIFTHDVNFYNYTMPTPVRVDASGMSDWTPMRTVDTAFVSPSNADKNHREFVWVFRVRRGTFNPAQFSSRRRPQYAKNESNMFGSHASDRTVEDALRFIEENGTSR